jgi:hypothetical protein
MIPSFTSTLLSIRPPDGKCPERNHCTDDEPVHPPRDISSNTLPKTNYQKNKIYRDRWNANNPIKIRQICKRNQRKYDAWKRIQKYF